MTNAFELVTLDFETELEARSFLAEAVPYSEFVMGRVECAGVDPQKPWRVQIAKRPRNDAA